ncbi:MAG: Dihydrolipoyl dehydrogenase [Bacteroidetes bacterium ADurb.Bin416]|jgi:dihydrolipoamide dehydrogenase|nr:MAG: Dihydrolipoyl dehydrogenase [Bacteroidetes bacterium ADurb.Bin416]
MNTSILLDNHYDLAVIGGGPAGYNAAEKAAAEGVKTIIFEKKALGGVCLNEGCIPTKALLYSAKIYDSLKTATKYGIRPAGEAEFDLNNMIDRKDKTVKRLTSGVGMKLSAHGVTVINGEAFIEGERDGVFIIRSGEKSYTATYLMLCTGSDTVIPPIKGLSETAFWTSREALEARELPQKLTIVGGGVIGMEFASFYNSLGVNVTVVELLPEILGSMDKEIARMLRNEYTKKGISFLLKTKVIEISPTKVTVERNGKTESLPTDRVLISVGRRPVLEGFGLEGLNLALDNKRLKVNGVMQTSHPRIYAVGDITGHSMLAHTAIREGEVAVNHLAGKKDVMRYDTVPSVVYTNPEVAGIGLTEEEATEKGLSVRVIKLPMAYSGRFVAENEGGNGLFKLLVDEQDVIVGCHILGNPASELIVTIGVAIERGLTLEDVKKIVFPHPTVGEIIHEGLYV